MQRPYFQISSHLRFWTNKNIFWGCYSTPSTSWGGGNGQAPFITAQRLSSGEMPAIEPVGALLPHSALSSVSCLAGFLPPEGVGVQGKPPDQVCTGYGASGMQSGHEATALLSLPSFLFAGLFLRVKAAEKKLKNGNGQWTWRKSAWGKADHLWTGFLTQPPCARLGGKVIL